MYKVSTNLTNAYGSDLDTSKKDHGLEMPHVTTNNRRMTNIKLANGEYIRGIRKNDDDSQCQGGQVDLRSGQANLKPLRYTPGMVCDPHLESLRPERSSKHQQAFSGGDEWKKKLIKSPETYEGSFADADMQQFRPNPAPLPPTSEPWFVSRIPGDNSQVYPGCERLLGASVPPASPYDSVYPQDELSRIKMRNRQFQNANGGGGPQSQQMMMPPMQHPSMYYYGYGPQMYPPLPPMMMPPVSMPMMQGYGMHPHMQNPAAGSSPMDDLKMLEQELNMTRQVTRPFIPTDTPEYAGLKKQRDIMEMPTMPEPTPKMRSAVELCPLSIDQLPPPKKVIPKEKKSVEPPARPRHDPVKIADQIAIRSIVLGHNLPKVGSTSSAGGKSAMTENSGSCGVRSPNSDVRSPTNSGMRSPNNSSVCSPKSVRSREQSV